MTNAVLKITDEVLKVACEAYRDSTGTGKEKMQAALMAAGFVEQPADPLDDRLIGMTNNALAAFLSAPSRQPGDPRTVGSYVAQCAIEAMSHLKVVAPETLA